MYVYTPGVSCQVSGCQKLFNSICTVRSWPMGKDTLCNLSTPGERCESASYVLLYIHWSMTETSWLTIYTLMFLLDSHNQNQWKGPTRQPTPPSWPSGLFHPSRKSDGLRMTSSVVFSPCLKVFLRKTRSCSITTCREANQEVGSNQKKKRRSFLHLCILSLGETISSPIWCDTWSLPFQSSLFFEELAI